MDDDTLEQAKRYCDDAFEIAAEECKALREEVALLRERIERLEAGVQSIGDDGQSIEPTDWCPPRFDPSD